MPVIQGYSSSEDEDVSSETRSIAPVLPNASLKRPRSPLFHEVDPIPKNKLYIDEATFKLGTRSNASLSRAQKRKHKRTKGNPEDDDFAGPWANFSSDSDLPEMEEQEVVDQIEPREPRNAENGDKGSKELPEVSIPSSEFVGTKQFDYQGRSYMNIPTDIAVNLNKKPGSQQCFVPKKIIHTYKGHNRGVTKLEVYRHLLLSAGNDGKIKLWDLYHDRELLRVFSGHNQAVKDISFSSKGYRFLSGGFDRQVFLWDTESGEILKTIKVEAIPNVVKFNPNNEDEILVGLSNKKIHHYNLANKQYQNPIQTYDHHLGAINSITIIENNKRFMTTADDKSVRFWDWQINIPIKVISEPSQYSMPSAVVYPGGNYIALQSMDNSIVVIQGHGKYKSMRKKTFSGHQVAGYGIGIDISPDGKILVSGDANGYGYFWDWKARKIINKLKVSNKPITCVKFHPYESSKVLLAGTTGEIYYCD